MLRGVLIYSQANTRTDVLCHDRLERSDESDAVWSSHAMRCDTVFLVRRWRLGRECLNVHWSGRLQLRWVLGVALALALAGQFSCPEVRIVTAIFYSVVIPRRRVKALNFVARCRNRFDRPAINTPHNTTRYDQLTLGRSITSYDTLSHTVIFNCDLLRPASHDRKL